MIVPQQLPRLRQNWQLKSRSIYIHVPIFKMKLYQPDQSPNPYLFFHLPQVKKVVAYTTQLKTLLKTYRFPQDPHAFQIMNIRPKDQQSRPYIVAGSTAGTIMCQSLAPLQASSQNGSGENDIFCLNIAEKDPQQNYVNDVLSLGNNKIVNCFNNGTIAFWDLNQAKRIDSLFKLHDSYTYKLRKIDQRLISCGHDSMTVVTDLVKAKPMTHLRNADSCWCSTPLNYNIVASVGLFNRVNVWDVRMRQLVQCAQLQNGETSFVTVFDENSLILGDGSVLKKCDLRTMRCNRFASENMLGSAENIIVTQHGGYVCGRRFEMCHFSSVQVPNLQVSSKTKIFNPFTQGDMFMYETVLNQNREEAQQQEDNQQQQEQEWVQEDDLIQAEEQMQEIGVIANEDLVDLGQEEIAYHQLVQEQDEQESQLVLNSQDLPVNGEYSSQIVQEKQSSGMQIQEESDQSNVGNHSQMIENQRQDQFHSIQDSSSNNEQSDS